MKRNALTLKLFTLSLFIFGSSLPEYANACGCDWMLISTARKSPEVAKIRQGSHDGNVFWVSEDLIDRSLEWNWPGSAQRQGGSDVMICHGIYKISYFLNNGEKCTTKVRVFAGKAHKARTTCEAEVNQSQN